MRKLLVVAFGLLAAAGLSAQTTQPILRLETGMHASAGKGLDMDAAGKYLLTASDDRTARLWDAATGRQLQVFRVPIDINGEGRLYAGALTADGRLAVVGGQTGTAWDDDYSIYLIETQTGNIQRRIIGLPGAIFDLEFSPDGRWLAVGMGGNKGVAIIRTENWSVVRVLSGYDGDVYSVAFDAKGRLISTCEDGKLRLYAANTFTPLQTATNDQGSEPYCVAFSPDGKLLAVGYDNSAEVEVRSAADLTVLYRPQLGEASTRAARLSRLCFSADGTRLYGASNYGASDSKDGMWRFAVRCWSNAGRGSFKDLLLSNNVIKDIKPLPNGGLAMLSTHPDLGVIGPNFTVSWYVNCNNNDFSQPLEDAFRVGRNGAVFGFKPYGQPAVSFEVPGRLLQEKESQTEPSVTSARSTRVDKGSVDKRPSINGKEITFLGTYERCVSADVTSDGRYAVLCGNWNLYCVDENGQLVWKTPLPSNGKSTNISGNDRVVLAQLNDGTVRWYNMTTGKELLAFFLHADKKRWVLFTPSGYYDASPGAEDLLGWHINKGKAGTPAYFPVSRFREAYYRPDIIDAVFDSYDETQAITEANSRNTRQQTSTAARASADRLPPTISILSPTGGSTVRSETVQIQYSLNTPDEAPVKSVKVLVNGRPVALERGLRVQPSNKYTVTVTIPSGDCNITLLAENDYGLSPEANLFLHYAAAEHAADEFVRKPKLYVLAVGISEYSNPEYKLNFADKDAKAFVAGVSQQKGKLYGDVVVKQFLNADATRENIQDGLQWIQEQTGQGDMAMIFYAGHGMNDNNGTFYMLPVAADVNRLRSTCLNFEELKQTVSSIAGKVVVFIDACHSGNVMGSSQRRGGADINAIVNELSSTQNGAITFTSSTGKEYSLEDPAWEHGAFTMALLEGLSGKAAIPGRNKITVKSLDAYISERVKDLTKGKQHPTSVVPPNVPDFPIGVQ